jgi:plastocyanin
MHHRRLPIVAITAVLFLVGACSGGGATSAPASAEPAPSAAASEPAASEPAAGGAACTPGDAAGEVTATIANFAFAPAAITATVGQTVTFTNNDDAPHTATLDDDSCTTETLNTGDAGGLTFGTAGTYPFHCAVHPNMKGTITVS